LPAIVTTRGRAGIVLPAGSPGRGSRVGSGAQRDLRVTGAGVRVAVDDATGAVTRTGPGGRPVREVDPPVDRAYRAGCGRGVGAGGAVAHKRDVEDRSVGTTDGWSNTRFPLRCRSPGRSLGQCPGEAAVVRITSRKARNRSSSPSGDGRRRHYSMRQKRHCNISARMRCVDRPGRSPTSRTNARGICRSDITIFLIKSGRTDPAGRETFRSGSRS